MESCQRHVPARRLRVTCPPNTSDLLQTKAERRRTSCRTRKAKSMRDSHHRPAEIRGTPHNSTAATTTTITKMERVERSLLELAQLLGLQTIGVDEASLLETTIAFIKAYQDSATSDSSHRGGRHAGTTSGSDSAIRQSEQAAPASPTDAILAGFQDCMEETIRYLVDVEGFLPDDEVVVGLTSHLLQARAKLDLNNDVTASTLSGHSSLDTEGPAECEATTSTQTSPQETNTHSIALSDNRQQPNSRTVLGGNAPRGLSQAHYMTPLTVDTNQYYALPSPLNRSAIACAMKPSESLLTVAQTRPTPSMPAYSVATAAGASIYSSVASRAAYQQHAIATTTVQQPYRPAVTTEGCVIPCLPAAGRAAEASQRLYGFNLNYVAPYVVAWVRPAQD